PPAGGGPGHVGRAAHLVAHAHLSSPRSLSDSRRRAQSGRSRRDPPPPPVPSAGQSAGRSLARALQNPAPQRTSRPVRAGPGQGVEAPLERGQPPGGFGSKRPALSLPLRVQDRHGQPESPAPGSGQGAVELSRKQKRP